MADPRPTTDEILEAVRASGYLMEQQLAIELEALGYEVSTNRAWEDPDEGKSREIDVWARRLVPIGGQTDCIISLELLCECKNNGYPLVCIGRPSSGRTARAGASTQVPLDNYVRVVGLDGRGGRLNSLPPAFAKALGPLHYYTKQPSIITQFCAITGHPSKFKAERDMVYDRLFYPLLKGLHAMREQPSDWLDQYRRMVRVICPLIVLAGPLYYIDASAIAKPIWPVEWLTCKRELRAKGLQGTFAIDFVTSSQLATFVDRVVGPLIAEVESVVSLEPSLLG